jgi:hypothetical protein
MGYELPSWLQAGTTPLFQFPKTLILSRILEQPMGRLDMPDP